VTGTPKTLGALALLTAALPANAALTAVALLRGLVVPPCRARAADPKTILISGGKMTKALQLARTFHRAGHRVVLVETAKYRWTGHRFSRAVDRFHIVPPPGTSGYAQALLEIVRGEDVDVYVPVCSPAASQHDADATALLSAHCEVLHADPDTVRILDDKFAFSVAAAELGLPVPAHHRIQDPSEVVVAAAQAGGPFVLKSIPYDPVNRLDLTPLPRPTREETEAFAAARPISPDTPWILQGLVEGAEFCTHSTVRDGVVTAYCCCPSSAFQVNYAMVDKPAIEAWVKRFVSVSGITGQVSFDFIEAADGTPYAIECNPRTHSAITLFHDQPEQLARAYLEDGAPEVRPLPTAYPTYWLYHEVWRLLTARGRRAETVRTILRGTDAIFDWDDPLPFLLVHHAQIPSLLLASLRARKDWIRIDFNIGKLVEAAGD